MRWPSRRYLTGSCRICAGFSATTCNTSPPLNRKSASPRTSTSPCAAPSPGPNCAASWPPPITRCGGPTRPRSASRGTSCRCGMSRVYYVDPSTGEVLPTWDEALDSIGDQDEPVHVARFGDRFDAQGVLVRLEGRHPVHRLPHQVPDQAGRRLPPGRRPTPSAARGPARRGAAVSAVLAAVRELAPLRHPAQERPARPGPRPCKGKAHDTGSPRLRRTPGPGLPQMVGQDTGRPPGRPQGLAAGHARCFGNRPGPVRLGTRRA